jgi:undecaprenyl-diphosphatase
MTPIQAVVLALVQAATEFLPVSSSGHLILIPRLLGWSDQGLEFDIATNTGTLIAILAYFRADLLRIARALLGSLGSLRRGGAAASAADVRLGWALILGTVPAAAVGLAIEHWVATYARDPRVIATTALVYGLLLLLADRWGRRTRELPSLGLREGVLIGCAQALALVPGTSRSGVTMTAALALGATRETAARFSFLLAVPVGLLVAAKQGWDLLRGVEMGVPLDALAIGIAVSAVAGYGVIALLLGWVRRRSLAVFAWYRLALGVFLLVYFRGS